jgi:hypothetical protein
MPVTNAIGLWDGASVSVSSPVSGSGSGHGAIRPGRRIPTACFKGTTAGQSNSQRSLDDEHRAEGGFGDTHLQNDPPTLSTRCVQCSERHRCGAACLAVAVGDRVGVLLTQNATFTRKVHLSQVAHFALHAH